jgi:CSLREA domain-containing protein
MLETSIHFPQHSEVVVKLMTQTSIMYIVKRLVLLLFLAGLFAIPAPVQAAGFISVTTTVDEFGTNPSQGCSLREAIYSANNDTAFGGCASGADVDTIYVPAGKYFLSLALSVDRLSDYNDIIGSIGDLDITSEMTIIGAGSSDGGTVISGLLKRQPPDPDLQISTRILEVAIPGINLKSVSLSNLKITGGFAQGDKADLTDENGVGGGLYNRRSSLTMYNVVVESNSATHSGGGIYNSSSFLAALYLYDSTISNNTTTDVAGGGGIMNKSKLLIKNSLISGNTSFLNGGGLITEAGSINNKPVASLINVTFTGNTTGAGKRGAAIYAANSVEIINSTIAYNPVQDGAAAVEIPAGVFTVIVNTIISKNTVGSGTVANCSFVAAPAGTNNLQDPYVSGLLDCKGFTSSDTINLSAVLSQNLGFHTEGFEIQSGSAAIEGGVSSYYNATTNTTYYCPGIDYRWAIRPMKGDGSAGGAKCDIGAYEANDFISGLPVFGNILVPVIFK